MRISSHAVIVHPEMMATGNHIAIDPFVIITTALELGNYVHIAPHCSIIGGVQSKLIMGDFSGLAAGCRIVCASDDYKGAGLINPTIPIKYRSVTHSTVIIEKLATLGTNVVVLPGITIGEGAVVGVSSVVTKNLEPWGIYAGVPARRVGMREKNKLLHYAELLMQETEGN